MRNVSRMLESHWISSAHSITNYVKSFRWEYILAHGIIPSLPVELGGNIVSIEVEVFNVPLDYNLLLSHSWT